MKPNKLVNEKSPYLQQHAYNPVEWHPWGEEALSLSKRENKPIFLSIGYSTCHWCHVMEHESFENPDIAALMNKSFINIKVDREERPDLDALYMLAVQALTGAGGWPMSIWLTPDLKPFYGGTYFPPENRYGRPGFPTVLTQLAEVWAKERERVIDASGQISALLEQAAKEIPVSDDLPPAAVASESAFKSLQSLFDSTFGGFGGAPKFPMPVYMDFLLYHHARTGKEEALSMVDYTVQRMAVGGIYDQLGGGFARYSTDERWIVPHFEKMLYDNAQLVSVIAGLIMAGRDHKALLRHTLGYVLETLGHPQGPFYSAEDADSEGKEGAFYLWTLNQLREVLGSDADLAIDRYGVTLQGNFMDPHTREAGQNVLVQNMSVEELANKHRLTAEAVRVQLSDIDRRLLTVRGKRPRPLRDEKILTEWNALMISALVRASAALNDAGLLSSAEKAAQFLKDHLYDSETQKLFRRWRDGERKVAAHQADYVFLVAASLDLFESTGRPAWLEWALVLQRRHDELFFDSKDGGNFMAEERPDLLVRMKDDGDNVIPSGNSTAVWNGLRLSSMTGDKDWAERARKTLRAFASRLKERPVTLASMTAALPFEEAGKAQVVVVGPLQGTDTQTLLKKAGAGRQRDWVIIPVDPQGTQKRLSAIAPFIRDMKMLNDRATAYVCVDHACRQPTTDATELEKQLGGGLRSWATRT